MENPLNTILTIKALLDTGQDATGNFAQISGIGGNITLDARDGFSVTENTVDAIVRNTNYLPGGGLLERYETKGEGNFGFIYSNDIRIRLVGRNRAPPIDADQI